MSVLRLLAFSVILEASENGIPNLASVCGVEGGPRGEEWIGGVIDDANFLLGDPASSEREERGLLEGVVNDITEGLALPYP
jgi:hypothetical protein